MKVIIKESVHEYISDFDDGWEFSRDDYFKYPVNVGSNNCFIRRFVRRPENISGWKLLNDLKEKNVSNLIRIYDIVKTNENGKIIYYVFFEFTEGKALAELISKKNTFNLEKFTDDLFNALQNLHTRNYWFANFREKDIIYNKNDHFLLTDLDKAQSLSNAPTIEMRDGNEYSSLVFKFCKDVLQYKEFKPSQLNGASFNYLQTVFLVLRLKIFYHDNAIEYDSVEFKNQLPHYLNNISSSFKKIFNNVFQNEKYPLESPDIIEIKNLIKEKIINITDTDIDKIIRGKIFPHDNTIIPDTKIPHSKIKELDQPPVIHEFTVSNYFEKNGNEFTIESGVPFILKWNVKNAEKVALYKNGQPYRQFDKDKNNVELKEEAFDGKEKLIEYTLVVSRSDDSLESIEKTSLKVKISGEAKKIIEHKPVIEFIVSNYLEKNQDYYVVESGKPFTLAWNVSNAQEIEIQKDGQHFKTVNSSTEKSIELIESDEAGKEKIINYTLSALSAGTSETSSRSVSIIVKTVKGAGPLKPVIKHFKASKSILRNGGSFILNWSVQNATDVALYKNEVLYKTFSTDERNIELKENYEGKERKIKYTLLASNGFEKAGSHPVIISVKPPFPLKMLLLIAAVVVSLIALYYIFIIHPNPAKIVFYPVTFNKIKAGDTVTIRGKDFPENDNSIAIKFNNIKGKIVQLTKDRIRVQVPEPGEQPGDVTIAANIKSDVYQVAQHLSYSDSSNQGNNNDGNTGPPGKPKIYQLNDFVITQNKSITIHGENLPTNDSAIQVKFNNVGATIIQRSKDSITVLVPELPDKYVTITAHIGGMDTIVADHVLYQKSDTGITDIKIMINPLSKITITENDVITITGDNIPQKKGDVVVKFNNHKALILQQTPRMMRVLVPSLPTEADNVNISLFTRGIVLRADDHVNYKPLAVTINSLSQKEVTELQNIVITGNNIPGGNGAVQVFFNNAKGTITSQTKQSIQVQVPSIQPNNRQVNIIVKVNGKEALNTNVAYQKIPPPMPHLCEFTTLTFRHYSNGVFGGKERVAVTLKNTSKYNMDSVIVEMSYLKGNGQSQTEELLFKNTQSFLSQEVRSSNIKDINISSVKVAVKSIYSKEFGLQKCK